MATFPGPRPFFWHPVDGHRHAILIRDRDVPIGGQLTTLCGLCPVRHSLADYDWFWPTCVSCWTKATELIDPQPHG